MGPVYLPDTKIGSVTRLKGSIYFAGLAITGGRSGFRHSPTVFGWNECNMSQLEFEPDLLFPFCIPLTIHNVHLPKMLASYT